MSICLAGHDSITMRPPGEHLLDCVIEILRIPLCVYFRDLISILELPEGGPGFVILIKKFAKISILVTVQPIVLIEELDDGKVFVPRVLVERLQCLQRVAHCIKVHIIWGEALLDLLINVHIPDILEHGSVEVRQRIPAVIYVPLFLLLLRWLLILMLMLMLVIAKIRPNWLSDQYLPEVSKALTSIISETCLPVKAHRNDLLEECTLVGGAIFLHSIQGHFFTLAPEGLPPVTKLIAEHE